MSGNNRKKNNAKNVKKIPENKKRETKAVEKTTTEEKRKLSGTELFMIIFAAVALVAIVASIIIGVAISSNSGKRVDYLNDNLGKYISISPEDYKNISGSIVSPDPVTDLDLEIAINKLLCEYKGAVKYDGKYVKNQTVTIGDKVYIYYRGYTLGDDGSRNYFDGGCNFTGANPSELEIGSGQFVPGFESNLLGKNPQDYSTFTKYGTSGTIGNSDKIYVKYTWVNTSGATLSGTRVVDLSLGKEAVDASWGVIGFYDGVVGKSYGRQFTFDAYADYDATFTVTAYRALKGNELVQITYSGSFFDSDTPVQGETAIVDLSDPATNEKFGQGFIEFFADAPVGIKADKVDADGKPVSLKTTIGEGESNAFYDITVNAIYEVGDNPLTVDAYFPLDYSEESLQGKWAKFDVYIMKSQEYEPAIYNDAFVTDTLKYTPASLAEYEGATMTEKHTAMLRADLDKKYENALNTALNNLIFEVVTEKAKIKKLPKNDVRDYYDSYYNTITSEFSTNYSSYYETVDAFARDYLGIASNADWKAEIQKLAEKSVTQKLAFYYVMQKENIEVPADEFEKRKTAVVEDYLNETLENYNIKRANYETEEKYLEKVEEYRKNILNYYTEDMLIEAVNYEYALEILRGYVTLTDGK